MIIFGEPFLDIPPLYHIDSIEAILHTPPNSVVAIELSKNNLEIIEHCKVNRIEFGVFVATIAEALIGENLKANYIIVQNDRVKTIQNIANEYLFSAKILTHVENHEQMEQFALEGIDGVIFPEGMVKVVAP